MCSFSAPSCMGQQCDNHIDPELLEPPWSLKNAFHNSNSVLNKAAERKEWKWDVFILQSDQMYWKDGGVGKTDSLAWQRVLDKIDLLRGFGRMELNRASCNDTLPWHDNSEDRLQPTAATLSASQSRYRKWMNEWSCNYSASIDWVVVATVNTERKTQSSGALSFCYCWF